jgi:hypothetical protein
MGTDLLLQLAEYGRMVDEQSKTMADEVACITGACLMYESSVASAS